MTDITELAQLRAELSNPAVGSKDHLRKLALSLVDALEKAQRANGHLREQSAEWERKAISNFEDCAEMSARIEELESQRASAFTACNCWADKFREAERRIAELEKSELQLIDERDIAEDALGDMFQAATGERPEWSSAFGISDAVDAVEQRLGELESRTVTAKPEDADGVREEGNQFLVVRHPGKVPVIKHPVGQLEDYLLQILKADPLATIDIVTHRYYGAGGQFVKDADEYLHEMGIKWEAE